MRMVPLEAYHPDYGWRDFRWVIVSVVIAVAILLFSIFTYAQELKTGDRLPDVGVVVHGADGSAVPFSALRGKVVVLDFWATWCAPCVMMIPRMDSLQREFGKKVEFVSVAYQPEAEVKFFMSKLEAQRGKHFDLAEVYGDTVLRRLFKPVSYPHYVWIGADGRVVAVTGFQQVTRENLSGVLRGGTVASTVRDNKEIAWDYQKPMLIGGNGGDGSNLLYHSFLTSYTPGMHPGLAIVNDSVTGRKITLKNNPLIWFFDVAWSDSGRNFNRQNTRLLVRDTARIDNHRQAGKDYVDWLARGNGFCYELQVPRALAPAALLMMRQDIGRYFTQYTADIIKEKRVCYVLSRLANGHSPGRSGKATDVRLDRFGWSMSDCTLGILCERINYYQLLPYPVVDESGIDDPVDIEVPISKVGQDGKPDIVAINLELAKFGLELKQAERTREILAIRDRQP